MPQLVRVLVFLFFNTACLASNTSLYNVELLISQHRFTEAKSMLSKIENTLSRTDPSEGFKHAFLTGVVNFELFNFTDALLWFEKTRQFCELNVCTKTKNGELHYYIGLVHKEGFYNPILARQFYQVALQYFLAEQNLEGIAKTNFQLARSYSFEDVDKREYHNIQALSFYETNPLKYAIPLAECYNLEALRLGTINGFNKRSEELFKKAIRLATTHRSAKLGKYLDNMGFYLSAKGSTESLFFLHAGLSFNKTISDNQYWVASSFNNLANYHSVNNNLDSVEIYLRKYRAIVVGLYKTNIHSEVSNAYYHLAILKEKFNKDSALFYFKKALFLETTSLNITSDTASQEHICFSSQPYIYTFLISDYTKLLYANYKKTGDKRKLSAALYNMHVFHKLLIKTVYNIDWETSRKTFLEDIRYFYSQYIFLLHEAYKQNLEEVYAKTALGVMEDIRYVSLSQNFLQSSQLSATAKSQEFVKIRGEFSHYHTLLNSSSPLSYSDKETIMRGYLAASKKYYDAIGKQRAILFNKRKNANKDYLNHSVNLDELILEYFDSDSAVFVVALNSNGASLSCISNQDISLNLSNFLSHFSHPPAPAAYADSLKSFKKLSLALGQKLLKPVYNDLKRYKSVTIIPDGRLHKIPFETFLVSDVGDSFSTLDYLLKHLTVKRSLTVQQSLEKPRIMVQSNTFAFGSSLLPQTVKEVELVKEYLGSSIFTDSACSVFSFKKFYENSTLLHLAVHGEADVRDPLNGFLVFGNKATDTLRSFEIYGMDMTNKFVILSSCQSGTGLVTSGEGVFSMSRSFFVAGASAVIMTLWNIADASTLKLMGLFYKGLSKGNSPEESLRKAKIELISSADNYEAHPIFWASLQMEGSLSVQDAKLNFLWWFTPVLLLVVFLIIKRKWLVAENH